MQLIKKYANRKLYHTSHKRYINLDDIARLIQAGEQVRIVDNTTDEDITESILVQVILQAREHNHTSLPVAALMGLIQFGGDTFTSLRRALVASFSDQAQIEADIARRLDYLVTEGTLLPDEATRLRHLLLRPDLSRHTHETGRLDALLPSDADIARLHTQIDALMHAVNQLDQEYGIHAQQEKHISSR